MPKSNFFCNHIFILQKSLFSKSDIFSARPKIHSQECFIKKWITEQATLGTTIYVYQHFPVIITITKTKTNNVGYVYYFYICLENFKQNLLEKYVR